MQHSLRLLLESMLCARNLQILSTSTPWVPFVMPYSLWLIKRIAASRNHIGPISASRYR